MELFSEIYSCYYNAIGKVLESSQKETLTQEEISNIINANAFLDSSFYIMPYLLSDEWSFLKKEGKGFSSKLEADTLKTPITILQKAWIKALLSDRRKRLFLDKAEIDKLEDMFSDVPALYENSHFHIFDAATDGDDYENKQYILNFRKILYSIKNKCEIKVTYDSGEGKRINSNYSPLKLNYSPKDDKFRLIAARVKAGKINKVVLNLARIKSVTPLRGKISEDIDTNLVLNKSACVNPIVLQILQGRNALERCMLQFASMEKQTEYDETTDSYICRIYYDRQDETELLIRILSFGPVVKVLGPPHFLVQIRERIKKQMELYEQGL